VDDLEQTVLGEAVKFTFAQVGAVLAAWKERRKRARGANRDPAGEGEVMVPIVGPEMLDGPVASQVVPADRLADADEALNAVYGRLAWYGQGGEPVDAADVDVQQVVRDARSLLEGLYGQRLTFVGERDRAATGTRITVEAAGDRSVAVGGDVAGSIVTGDNSSAR
jgi:hypothetical protein